MIVSGTRITIRRKVIKLKRFHLPHKPFLKLTQQQLKLVSEFNDRVKRGAIKFEIVPCLCGNTEFDLVASVDSYGMLQDTVLCTKCGLILSNPRMAAEEYSDFYTRDLYRICYVGEDYIEIYKKTKYKIQTGQHIFDEINEITPIRADTAVLEFGGGGGWNLLPFIKAGANIVGMDYSPSLVNLGKEYGINMIQGGLSDIKGSYDVIILNHVLEHFSDPIESLKMILDHLAKEGIIYIAVPNIMNFAMEQLQNAHPWYFSPKTLAHYGGLAGLKLLKSGSAEVIHMFGIFELSPNNIDDNNDSNELVGHYDELVYILRKAERREFIKQILSYIHFDKIARAVYKRTFQRRQPI